MGRLSGGPIVKDFIERMNKTIDSIKQNAEEYNILLFINNIYIYIKIVNNINSYYIQHMIVQY